ncbi:apoptotic chromatin condensation inducer in the nucleus-like isoform X2 [Bolinopsis microptera]|uniref:apoptotic chromatin condensation inducer in the nucleus-like isoform X2 n=1 Tax=Bolinopsis microptera TaxID=2820187 RepID=UPI003079C4F0
MDITLDFDDSLNKTDASKMDISQESESDQEKVDDASQNNEGEENDKSDEGSISSEESQRQEENNADGSSEEKENKSTDGEKSDSEEEISPDKPEESSEKQGNEEEGENKMDATVAEPGETGAEPEEGETVAEPEFDTIELTSNEFENDLLGAAIPVTEDASEEKVKEVPVVEKVVQKVKPAPKKSAPPPKIHKRTFEESEEQPERPRIQWECKLVKNIISTTLLKDLIEVKLNKEEENNEANLARGRRNRPIRTTSGSEPKKKVVRKEDEDLDFEPESEHDSDSEEEKDATRDPTAFPAPPAEAVGRSRKDENRALLVTNLIRPFTVLQLKTMLSHCGKVKSIWINTIKSRCYVVFATVGEATRARQSLHGAVWPLTSPKTLNVDYAEDERMYSETDGELIGDSIDIQVFEEQKRKKPRKEKGDKKEAKKTLLDDFFKKTVAVPSIYWLPLNEKEAKARAEERAKGKPRYFVPEPELDAEYVRPRAIPRWKTPERTRSPARRRVDDRRRR